MLIPASWLPVAKELDIGQRLRTDHDCGPGRTLTVSHDDRGLHAFCFRCNEHGWAPPAPVPLGVRLERIRKAQEADQKVSGRVALPEPRVTVWAAWPAPCRLWLLKAGLSSHDLPKLGAYYHPPSDRVVLPVLGPSMRLLFWQARAVDGRQPKYLAPPVDKQGITPMYGSSDVVTLTEDLLSAYKVGKVGEGWSLLGTSLSAHTLGLLVTRNCKVNVWLDPDGPGQRAATKVLAKLRSTGIEAKNIVSDRDPKLIHCEQIKELLTWNSE
jgi:hypothetical protein